MTSTAVATSTENMSSTSISIPIEDDSILVRLISTVGDEDLFKVGPNVTALEVKRMLQAKKRHLKPDRVFFFHELKHISNNATMAELDYPVPSLPSSASSDESNSSETSSTESQQQDAVNALATTLTNLKMTTRKTRSVALIYAFDYLGRWSDKNSSRNRGYGDEIMVQNLLRFDAKGFEAHEIIDKLWLGNINSAFHLHELQDKGITHVITVHNSLKPLYLRHFNYMIIEAEDLYYVNLIDHFNDAIQFIEEGRKQGGVLIHCAAGVSRSATITIAYIMHAMQKKCIDAFRQVREKRAIISPNDGFSRQLVLFEQMNCDLQSATEEQKELLDAYKKCKKETFTRYGAHTKK